MSLSAFWLGTNRVLRAGVQRSVTRSGSTSLQAGRHDQHTHAQGERTPDQEHKLKRWQGVWRHAPLHAWRVRDLKSGVDHGTGPRRSHDTLRALHSHADLVAGAGPQRRDLTRRVAAFVHLLPFPCLLALRGAAVVTCVGNAPLQDVGWGLHWLELTASTPTGPTTRGATSTGAATSDASTSGASTSRTASSDAATSDAATSRTAAGNAACATPTRPVGAVHRGSAAVLASDGRAGDGLGMERALGLEEGAARGTGCGG